MAKRTRNRTISFRVTEAEREFIENRRRVTALDLRTFMMACLQKKKITVKPGAELVAAQLKKIGNNLNQLTRQVNSGFVPKNCSGLLIQIRDEISEVRRIWQ